MSAEAVAAPLPREAQRLRELSPEQWKSGLAAWLGWTFDGLDMHLYTLVAAPFVMELLGAASPSAGPWAAVSSAASATGRAAAVR